MATEESALREWNARRSQPLPKAELDHLLQRVRGSHIELRPVPGGVSQLRE